MSAKSRGSRPFSDETERRARVMRAFAMRWMPSAASSTVSPSGSATRSHRLLGELARRSRSGRRRPRPRACSRARRWRRSPSARRRRGRSRRARDRRRRCAARPAGRRPGRARRCCRRRRRPRRCRSSGSAAARRRRGSAGCPAEIEPPTSYSRPREMAPFSISDALAVVPPMSKAITFSIPSRCAIPSAATTPAAGPDSSANTGRTLGVVGRSSRRRTTA